MKICEVEDLEEMQGKLGGSAMAKHLPLDCFMVRSCCRLLSGEMSFFSREIINY